MSSAGQSLSGFRRRKGGKDDLGFDSLLAIDNAWRLLDRIESLEAAERPIESGQYVSLAFGQQARDAGIAMSMGSKGDCFDNAVAEAFLATLKKELVHRRSWPTRQELQSAVFDYIESFYNRERRHSTLGYLSPREFEKIYIDKDSEEETVKP
jgi:putative transposase